MRGQRDRGTRKIEPSVFDTMTFPRSRISWSRFGGSYFFSFSVVILCASPTKVREILLAAEGLGLMDRGEYVFFNVELFAR